MKKFCDTNGHAAPYKAVSGLTYTCLNCGDEFIHRANLAPVDFAPSDPPVEILPDGAIKFLDSREPAPMSPYCEPEPPAAIKTDHMGDGKPETKPTNPKDAVGVTKLPISWVPTAVTRYAALAFAEGALKYGRYNWRVAGVRMSIYLDALHRHLMKLQDGEWADGDSLGLDAEGNRQGTGIPHLASIIACAGIILDANECDKLTDDRPPINPAVDDMMTTRIAHIAYLKRLFADYSPHQNVITDAQASPQEPQAE